MIAALGRIPLALPASRGEALALGARPALVAALLVAVNLAFKLPQIGAQGLWFDEAVTLGHVQRPFDLARSLASDASAPLFDVSLYVWSGLFGDSLEAARTLSALLSAGTAALLFLFGRRFFDARTGLFAALLFTTSRVQIFYGHEARAYALVGFLCVSSFYAFLRLLESPTRARTALCALIDAALVYAHYVAVFALAAQLLAAVCLVPVRSRAMRAYVLAQVLAALLFAPCAVYLVWSWPLPMASWIPPPRPYDLIRVLEAFTGGPALLAGYVLLLAAGLVAAQREEFRNRSLGRDRVVVLALWAFAPLLLDYVFSFWVPSFLYRYLLYCVLGLFLLAGVVAGNLALPEPLRWLLLVALLAGSIWSFASDPMRRPDWRRAAEIARQEGRPGALTIVTPPYQLLPFAHHYSPEAFREEAPAMVALLASEGVHATSRLEEAAEAAIRDRRKLVVIADTETDRRGGELDAMRARLTAGSYRPVRAERLTGIDVLVFEARR